MLDTLLNAVQALGNVVDTPGSVVRGLLSGNPSRALSGILDPSQRVYGSEITGDPYSGFAVDMALDPLNLVGGLGLLKTAKAAKLAKANNLQRAQLLAKGGMPEEVAKATKIVSKSGKPLKAMHGSSAKKIKTFKSSTVGETGPGIYFTDDKGVADFFANENRLDIANPQPTIHKRFLDIRNPLNFKGKYEGMRGDVYFKELADAGVDPRKLGFDGLIYPIDDISNIDMGSLRHTFQVFDPSQIYQPFVAPAAQRVPSKSPLLAALAGLNIGRAGREAYA